jgi:hypothetical protein
MGNARGLKNRLCPRCSALTSHRTLYAMVTAEGKRRWTELFWACEMCRSLNHVILPSYNLGSASMATLSPLAVAVVKTLEQGPLHFELVTDLRRKQSPLPGHVFKAGVALTLEFLRGRGVVVPVLVQVRASTLGASTDHGLGKKPPQIVIQRLFHLVVSVRLAGKIPLMLNLRLNLGRFLILNIPLWLPLPDKFSFNGSQASLIDFR